MRPRGARTVLRPLLLPPARRAAAGTALVVAVMLALVGQARAEPFLLAGNDEALWLVKLGPSQTFQVLQRPAGGKWRWVQADSLSGVPMRAAAIGASLHLWQTDPEGYLIFTGDLGETVMARNPDDPRWPRGVQPLAVCQAVNFARSVPPTVLAIVPHAATPTTSAASSVAPEELAVASRPDEELADLAVFQNASPDWAFLTDLPRVRLEGQTRVLAAAAKGVLYVLLSQPAGHRMAAWDGADWTDLSLAGLSPGATPLAMPTFRDRPALLLALPSPSSRQALALARLGDDDRGFRLQPVTAADGQPMSWEKADPPQAARLADQLALVWQEEGKFKLALVDPLTARVLSVSELPILQEQPPQTGGQVILERFREILLVAALLAGLLLRPGGFYKPFAVPADALAARALRRLAAVLIDLVPFAFVGSAVFPAPVVPEGATGSFWSLVMRQMDSPPAAYAAILSLLLYTGYATVMEYRFGATLGKRMMKLRVLGEQGRPVDFRSAVVRNLWRAAELSVPVLLLAMILGRYHRRLGDIFAQTVVIAATPATPPPRPQDADPPA